MRRLSARALAEQLSRRSLDAAFKASDVTQFKRSANFREGFEERKSENKRQEQEEGTRTRCTRREEERET